MLLQPLQNGWGRDSARARGAPLVHSPNERKRERERKSEAEVPASGVYGNLPSALA